MKFSRGNVGVAGWLRASLGVFLISPYLVWIARVKTWTTPDVWITLVSIRGTLVQATLSTAAIFAFGWILFRALRAWPAPTRARGEVVLLLPGAVPALFVALALMNLTPAGFDFPFGLGAVITAHALIYSGLVAVALERIERQRLGHLAEVSWVMGASERAFWCRGAWPVVRRDVTTVTSFIFVMCATGFSLPVLLQGSRATSIEVAIYDLVRWDGAWDQAVVLAVGQALTLLAFTLLIPGATDALRSPAPRDLPYRPHVTLRWLCFAPALILASGLARGFDLGHAFDPTQLAEAWVTTALIGAGVATTHLILTLITAFALPHQRFERLLAGYLPPGAALTGFAVLVVWPTDFEIAGTTIALALMAFAPLYRWQLHSGFASLRAQWASARTLGAGARQIFLEITWPQVAPLVMNAAGLAAIWACGDFAVSGILLGRAVTLPRMIFDHLEHYAFGAANAALLPLVATAAGLYFTFSRMVARVRD